MKQVSLKQLRSDLGRYVREEAQGGQVVITDRGRPTAILVGIDEDALDPADLRILEERARPGRKTLSWAEAKRRLGLKKR